MSSIFEPYTRKAWPHFYEGVLTVQNIHGGVPRDPKTLEYWIGTKITDKDLVTREKLTLLMAERGISEEEAADELAKTKINGFYRDNGNMYIPGNHLKACLKEAVSVAANSGDIPAGNVWGNPTNANYKKGIKAWFPEHVFVVQNKLHLGVHEDDATAWTVDTRFTRSQYGSSITREEVIFEANIHFSVETDHAWTEEHWAVIWSKAERLGLGASRSQGFGRFEVTKGNWTCCRQHVSKKAKGLDSQGPFQ